jgi:hypothetical protein
VFYFSAIVGLMGYHKPCSICSTPNGAQTVDAMLEKRTTLKAIAAQTGFSKSSVGRHSQKCVIRAQAAKLKSNVFNPLRDRILVRHADPKNPNAALSLPKDFDPEHDWIVRVSFEPTPASVLAVLERQAARKAMEELPSLGNLKSEDPKPDSKPVLTEKTSL